MLSGASSENKLPAKNSMMVHSVLSIAEIYLALILEARVEEVEPSKDSKVDITICSTTQGVLNGAHCLE